ncbi:MAG: hypothetical protein EPN94_02810, partial [Nitrospirae bacterium]
MRFILPLLLVALFVSDSLFTPVHAAGEEKPTMTDQTVPGTLPLVEKAYAEKKDAEDSFLKGANFGAGIMANIFAGGKKPVESARVVNGVVRVEEEGRGQVGVVAEFHTLWSLCKTPQK